MKKAIEALNLYERREIAGTIHRINIAIGFDDEAYDEDLFRLIDETATLYDYKAVKAACDIIQVNRIADDLDSVMATRFWEDLDLEEDFPELWEEFSSALRLYEERTNQFTWDDLAKAIMGMPEELRKKEVIVDLTAADEECITLFATYLECPACGDWWEGGIPALDVDASMLREAIRNE